MTAALSVAGAGVAQAHDKSDSCGQVSVKYSLDGGKNWTTDGRINGNTAPTTITVKLTNGAKDGCSYAVSLASYSAEGPTWQTSGTQGYLGMDSTTLSKTTRTATLDVSGTAPTCFGQVDLYGNGIKYDGTGGALPHYPDSATPVNLITAWNGGAPCTTPTTPPVTTPPTDTPTPTPTDSGTPTPTPTDTGTATPTPTDSGTPTPTPTGTGTSTPTPVVVGHLVPVALADHLLGFRRRQHHASHRYPGRPAGFHHAERQPRRDRRQRLADRGLRRRRRGPAGDRRRSRLLHPPP
ncbi:hypothetical protein GA0115240_16812 [Streptomyces sp. DvalAA-14]|nr:hypothetical protein GA0115240_16812 [Streptomyces sp. DvalAA-14]